MRRRGFTIIELLVTVLIIGVLVTFACAQFANVNEKAKDRRAREHLTALLKTVEAFGHERGTMPSASEFDTYNLTGYGARNETFFCPKDGKKYLYHATVAGKSWVDWYAHEDTNGDFDNAVTVYIVRTDGAPFKERGVSFGLGIYRNGTVEKI